MATFPRDFANSVMAGDHFYFQFRSQFAKVSEKIFTKLPCFLNQLTFSAISKALLQHKHILSMKYNQ